MKFSIEYFFSKWDQIRWKPWIWSLILNKSLIENFIFVQWQSLSFNVVGNSHHRSSDHYFGMVKEELDNTAITTGNASYALFQKLFAYIINCNQRSSWSAVLPDTLWLKSLVLTVPWLIRGYFLTLLKGIIYFL